ncbi:MAG: DUF4381 domain-containing protein [Cellvibrionaceae bacterium]
MEKNTLPLDDIITPQTISLWPLAPAWWIFLIAIITTIFISFLLFKRYIKKWAYRKEALALTKQYHKQWKASNNHSEFCQHLLTTLKRTAMTAYPSQSIETLYGKQWIELLNNQVKKPFDETLTHTICYGQYQKELIDTELDKLYQQCQYWINQHSVSFQEEN